LCRGVLIRLRDDLEQATLQLVGAGGARHNGRVDGLSRRGQSERPPHNAHAVIETGARGFQDAVDPFGLVALEMVERLENGDRIRLQGSLLRQSEMSS
jgi:hypothetical protein